MSATRWTAIPATSTAARSPRPRPISALIDSVPDVQPARRPRDHHRGPSERLLPALDARRAAAATIRPEMKAMVAYMAWLKGEVGPDGKIRRPRPAQARSFDEAGPRAWREALSPKNAPSATARAAKGPRTRAGDWIFPPLWGDQSFNIGAGMARTSTARRLRQGEHADRRTPRFPQDQGGLSDQDALDVAEFFTHQPRPDFPAKVNDWPKGGKPVDSRY